MSVWSIWDQDVSKDYLESVVGKYLIAEVTHRNRQGEIIKRSRIDGRIARICDEKGVVIKTPGGEGELCLLDADSTNETEADSDGNDDAKRAYQQALRSYQQQQSPLSITQAFEECQMAAKQGYLHAQYLLGVFYARGFGVKKDYIAAVKWFTKAAEQGHAPAQYNLGDLYCKGIGVVKSRRRAVTWFCRAALQGQEKAKKKLQRRYAVAPSHYEELLSRLQRVDAFEDEHEHSSEWSFYVPHNTTDYDFAGKLICLSGRLLKHRESGQFRRVN